MNLRPRPVRRNGFTLIELLVVIAIILILIAIALPNFLEAQIRAKVTRAEGDMHTLRIAVESYYGDRRIYPYLSVGALEHTIVTDGFRWLTSPIAYLQGLPLDPFSLPIEPPVITADRGPNYKFGSTTPLPSADLIRFTNVDAYVIWSYGPNVARDSGPAILGGWPFTSAGHPPCEFPYASFWSYSPTNGSRSVGDLFRFGGEFRAGKWCLDGVQIVGRNSNIERPYGGPGELAR